MELADVEALSGTNLEFAFAKVAGYKIIGKKDGPFALLHANKRMISVFGGDETNVEHTSFMTKCVDLPLELGRVVGATMRVEENTAICEIGQIVTHGKDYIEALLRALVILLDARGAPALESQNSGEFVDDLG
jgi:hypothetical protein